MSGPEIPDAEEDYLSERSELNLSDCIKRAEIYLSPREKRGRYLAAEAALAETDVHPVVSAPPAFNGLVCAFALVLAGLAIFFAGMVLGHLFLLPDATVWPMGVVSLMCAGGSAWLAWLSLRELP